MTTRGIAKAWRRASVAALLIAAGTPAAAGTLETSKVRNWTVGAYTSDQTGEFTRCSMSVGYKSGISLIFSIDRKYDWAMALINDKWRLGVGETHAVSFRIDRDASIAANAKVLTNTMIGIELRDTTDLFNDFRRGRLLVITTGREDFSFRLDGTSDGLAWLLRCVKRWQDYQPPRVSSTDPFGTRPNTNPFGGGSNAAGADPGGAESGGAESGGGEDVGTGGGGRPLPSGRAILNSPIFRPSGPAAQPAPAPVPVRPPIADTIRIAPPAPAPVQPPAPAPAPAPTIEARVQPVVPQQPVPPPVAPLGVARPAPVPPPVPGGAATSIETRVESTIFLATLMASAGISDYRVMPPGEAPDRHRGADVVFSAPAALVGTVRIVEGPNARAIASGIIADDAQACSGQYASGNVPASGGRGDVSHVFTGCDRGGQPASARYSILPRNRGGFFVVGIHTDGASTAGGDRLKQLDGSIREASATVAGRF